VGYFQLFVNVFLKMFFVFTPFFVISMFLVMTKEFDERRKHRLAVKVTIAVIGITFFLFICGKYAFNLFGITLDAFRIGSGVLLFLSAITLVQGDISDQKASSGSDIAVVPLALPITVGPATVGALLVMGAEPLEVGAKVVASCALLCAVLTIGSMLYLAGKIERVIGQNGLVILSKLTGLILASIAAQIIFTGIKNFLSA
jgi:multiple antibiotic resistance protein